MLNFRTALIFVLLALNFMPFDVNAMGGKSPVVPTPPASGGVTQIPIVMYVITNYAGQGNDKWLTKDYTDRIVNDVNEIYNSKTIKFYLAKKYKISDNKIYDYSQGKLLDKYDGKAVRGQVTIVISGEKYDGKSSGITHGKLDSKPFFVMRSRYNSLNPNAVPNKEISQLGYYNSANAIRATAYLFTHELGHEMGLDHTDQIKRNKGEILHTENYVFPGKDGNVNNKGRNFYENFFKNCLAAKSKNCRMGSIK